MPSNAPLRVIERLLNPYEPSGWSDGWTTRAAAAWPGFRALLPTRRHRSPQEVPVLNGIEHRYASGHPAWTSLERSELRSSSHLADPPQPQLDYFNISTLLPVVSGVSGRALKLLDLTLHLMCLDKAHSASATCPLVPIAPKRAYEESQLDMQLLAADGYRNLCLTVSRDEETPILLLSHLLQCRSPIRRPVLLAIYHIFDGAWCLQNKTNAPADHPHRGVLEQIRLTIGNKPAFSASKTQIIAEY
jgi:hypothetical protein